MSIGATMVLYAAVFFACGWGWGQWWAERTAREARDDLERGRLTVSMPIEPGRAAGMLELLAKLMRQVDATKPAAANAEMTNVRAERPQTAAPQPE